MDEHSHWFKIKIEGHLLGGDVKSKMVMAMVEDTRNAPDLFVLSFLDPDLKGPNSLLEKMRASIGSPVEISVVSGVETSGHPLFKGEVTAIETEFDAETGTHTVIRGFDQSHRLFRGNKTKAWTGSFSDIASKIAMAAKLTIGKIDPTSPVFDHVPQFNMSDWEFLKWMAAESNREMQVGEGKFEFRKSVAATTAPAPKRSGGSATPGQLELSQLLRFHAMVSAADQVKEVVVRGWDYMQKKAVMGKALATATSAKVGTSPDEIAGKVGNPVMVEVNSPSGPLTDPHTYLDNVANSIAEQIGAAHAEIEFIARGNHELRAGTPISFAGAGKLFDGQGVLTATRHVYEPKTKVGYRTFGFVTGRQDRSLFALTGGTNGNGTDAGPLGARRIEGVVPAIVVNNNDDKNLGRVKLRFPWLDGDPSPQGNDEKYVSDWARVVYPGAGENRGWLILPEVNDEVMVAFEQGDIRYPVVLGGVWNGKSQLPYGSLVNTMEGTNGTVNRQGIKTRTGHRLLFVDEEGSRRILIVSSDDNHSVELDEANQQVFITAPDVVIDAKRNLILKAGSNVEITADREVTIKGTKVNIN